MGNCVRSAPKAKAKTAPKAERPAAEAQSSLESLSTETSKNSQRKLLEQEAQERQSSHETLGRTRRTNTVSENKDSEQQPKYSALTLREVTPEGLRSINSASSSSQLSKLSTQSSGSQRSFVGNLLTENTNKTSKHTPTRYDNDFTEIEANYQHSLNHHTGSILASFNTKTTTVSTQTTSEGIVSNTTWMWTKHQNTDQNNTEHGQTNLKTLCEETEKEMEKEDFDKDFGHFLVEKIEQQQYLNLKQSSAQLSMFSTSPSTNNNNLKQKQKQKQRENNSQQKNKLNSNDSEEAKITKDMTNVFSLNSNKRKKNRQNTNSSPALVELRDLWKEKTVVIQFFRRFGCPLCRNTALKISALGKVLEENNIKLVGIGLSKVSLEGVIKGNYFRGFDIFVDRRKQLYTALDFAVSSYSKAFSQESLNLNKEREINKVSGDFSPFALKDSRQLGGTFCISKTGKLLFSFRQQKYGDLPNFKELFQSLSLDETLLENKDKLPFEIKQPVKQETDNEIESQNTAELFHEPNDELLLS